MTVENQGSEPLKNCLGGGVSVLLLFVCFCFVCLLFVVVFLGVGVLRTTLVWEYCLGGGGGGGGFSGQHLTFAEHISPFQSRVSFGVNAVHLGVRDLATLKEQDNLKKIPHSVQCYRPCFAVH